MRRTKNVESGRDRRALARDAGLGTVSSVSVVAGALCAFGALAALLAIGAGLAVAIHGGINFGDISESNFKVGLAVLVAVAAFVSFVYGGYAAGRMARRGGAINGLVTGIVGVVLGAAVLVLVKQTGGDAGLARVARHLGVPATWHQWRNTSAEAGVASIVAMLVGGLLGGLKGEHWHTKLLARAADSSIGPEAERLAAARRGMTEAAAAHDGAADRAESAAAAERAAGAERVAAAERAAAAERETAAERATSEARVAQASAAPRTSSAHRVGQAANETRVDAVPVGAVDSSPEEQRPSKRLDRAVASPVATPRQLPVTPDGTAGEALGGSAKSPATESNQSAAVAEPVVVPKESAAPRRSLRDRMHR